MRSDLDVYREAASEPIGIRPGGDVRVYTTGILLGVDPAARRALVSVNGSTGAWLPVLNDLYEGVRTVHVLLSPHEGGRAQLVLGAAETGPGDPVDDPLPQPPPPPQDEDVTARVVLTPQWTGTWQAVDRSWPQRMGAAGADPTSLTQGLSPWRSGVQVPDVGLAVYGSQVANLAATQITSAVLRVARIDTGAGAATLVVQGSPHATARPPGGPAPAGPTATSGPVPPARAAGQGPSASWTSIELPAPMREALRTGTTRSLALVGADHCVWGGTATPGSFALDVTYTRPS